MITKEQIMEKVAKFDGEMEALKEQYNRTLGNIETDTRLSESGRKEDIINLWGKSRDSFNDISKRRSDELMEMLQARREAATQELERLKGLSLADSKLTDKDITYIGAMLDRADDETLKGIAKQYDYDMFALNLINSRDSKKPNYINDTAGGENSNQPIKRKKVEKLFITHPLEAIADERIQEDYRGKYNADYEIIGINPSNNLWND